jgi:NTP pyrophosphatase (non-canonical NTP hydrolase)
MSKSVMQKSYTDTDDLHEDAKCIEASVYDKDGVICVDHPKFVLFYTYDKLSKRWVMGENSVSNEARKTTFIPSFDELISKIAELNESETRSFFEKGVKLQEETGEFAAEALKFVGRERISKKGTANTANLCEEAADMCIVSLSYTLDALKSAGCTKDDLLQAIANKLPKWENNLIKEAGEDELEGDWYPCCGMNIIDIKTSIIYTIRWIEDSEIILHDKDADFNLHITFDDIYDITKYKPFGTDDAFMEDVDLDNILDDLNHLIASNGICPSQGCRHCVISYLGFGNVCTQQLTLKRAKKLRERVIRRQEQLANTDKEEA